VISLKPGPEGQRRRKKVSGRNKTEVRAKLAELHDELNDGVVTNASHTVAQAINDWLADGLVGRAPKTVSTQREVLEPLIGIIGVVPLRELTAATVRSALKDLAATRATRTVAMAHAGLTRAIRHAEANDKVRRNVATLVDTPVGREGRPSKSLTFGQAVGLIQAARSYGLYAYVVLSLLVGIRTEEARALRWDHVDLDGDPDAEPPVPPHVDVWRCPGERSRFCATWRSKGAETKENGSTSDGRSGMASSQRRLIPGDAACGDSTPIDPGRLIAVSFLRICALRWPFRGPSSSYTGPREASVCHRFIGCGPHRRPEGHRHGVLSKVAGGEREGLPGRDGPLELAQPFTAPAIMPPIICDALNTALARQAAPPTTSGLKVVRMARRICLVPGTCDVRQCQIGHVNRRRRGGTGRGSRQTPRRSPRGRSGSPRRGRTRGRPRTAAIRTAPRTPRAPL